MSAVYAVGTFTIPGGSTLAISSSLTWNDGGSYTPQLLLLQGGRAALDTTLQTVGSVWAIGATDGTTQACLAGGFKDAGTGAQDCATRITDNGCLMWSDNGTEAGLLTFTSFSVDQIIVRPTNDFPAAWTVGYVAFANCDNVLVRTDQLPTATGAFSQTGSGFQPDTGIFILSNRTSMDNGGNDGEYFSTGFVDNSGNIAGIFSRSIKATTSYCWRACSTASLMAILPITTSSFADSTTFQSWDADGLTLYHDIAAGSRYYYISILLKGLTSKIVTTTTQQSTGIWNTSATGIIPKCAILISDYTSSALPNTIPIPGGGYTIGVHSVKNQWSFQYQNHAVPTLNPAVTEIYQRRTATRTYDRRARTALNTFTLQGHISASSLSTENVAMNQTDADPTIVTIPMLLMGDPFGSSTIPQIYKISKSLYLNYF